MRLETVFYSKDELAIQIDYTGRYPFPENETSELFALACFTLRQLSNLGEHIVSQALAAVLVTRTCIENAYRNDLEFPDAAALSRGLISFAMESVPKSWEMEKILQVSIAAHERFVHPAAIRQALENDIISRAPNLVNYHGKGKKSFEVTLPPFVLKMNGFGIFGQDVNHHAFHATIGLIRFLGQKHPEDNDFLEKVIAVANQCGSAFVFQQIPADQVPLATTIINNVGLG